MNGTSIGEAVRTSGGEPTDKEMILVNEKSMNHFADLLGKERVRNVNLEARLAKLEKRDEWLSCLEEAGVDNWEGYSVAHSILQERNEIN